jgi:creatinine amidohydrolase
MLSSIVIAAALAWQTASAQPKGVRLERLAWPEAEAVLHADAVVVVPLGGGAVEHGPHLKLGNDARLAEYFTRRIADASTVVAAPPLSYHYYPAFVEYPGSTSLPLATARDLTADIVRSLARFGPRRFYVLNTGIADTQPLQLAAKALAAEGILLHYTEFNARFAEASRTVRRQEGGNHADEIETSMMLYIDAGDVDVKIAARDFSPASSPFRLTRTEGGEGTYSPTGIWGNATLATRDKGRVVVEALVKTILEEIETLRTATPPPRVPASSTSTRPSVPPRPPMPSGRRGGELATCTPGDERRIREIGEIFSVAWTNQDIDKLVGLWTLDGDIVHPDGYIERGRRVIMENRRELFTRREYRHSRHPLTLAMIRCITPDVAVADGKWELRGVLDNTGKALPIMEGLVTVVATRNPFGSGWLIEAYRYTFKPPTTQVPPTILKRPGYPGG